MNPLSSRLKSQLFESTQNLKFNLLLNTNVQNIKSVLKNQPIPIRKNVISTSIVPLQNLVNHKQPQISSKISNKLNQLKKKSFSQRKIFTQTKSNTIQQNLIDKSLSKRKRLISASSMSKIKIVNEFSDFTIQKQTLANKETAKRKSFFKQSQFEKLESKSKINSFLLGSFALQTNTINLQLRSVNKQQHFVKPLKSDREGNLSINSSAPKQILQVKAISFTDKIYDQQGMQFISSKKSEIQKDKKQQLSNLISNMNNTLTLFFKDGSLLSETMDFKIFQELIQKKKSENQFHGQNLSSHMKKIKSFVLKYKITSSIKIVNIIQFQNKKTISNWQILNLFYDWKKIFNTAKKNGIAIKGIIFYFPDSKKGADLAAHKITMFFRNIKDQKLQKKMISLMSKVIKIQKHWRRALVAKRFREKIVQNALKKLEFSSMLQKKFIQNYQIIKTSRKIEIHIGSLSFEQFKRVTFENKNHYENSQISRIFKSLESPDTFIIYVTPIRLNQGLVKYYQRLFKIATGSDSVLKERVYFIYSENTEKISKICELTTINYLLNSPKALKRIKMLIKSIASTDNCFIVPSYPSIEYVNLSYELKVPIFSSSLTLSKLYSTKIGFRQIMNEIIEKQKPNPPFRLLKSVSSIFSEKQLVNTLALLIYKNQDVKKWYFKIDDEFNSRGIAYFNVNSINFLKKLNDTNNHEILGDLFENDKEIIKIIATELKEKLKQRLKILHKQVYPSYNQYMSHFLTRGGIIEAAPQAGISRLHQMSVSFVIEPNGDFEILGSFTKLELNSRSVCNSVMYPAKNCSKVDIEKIVRHLYRRIYMKKKLFGYFTIDLLFQENEQSKYVPYVLGLSCFLTVHSSELFLIKQLTKVRYDKDLNIFLKFKADNDKKVEHQSLKSSKISKLQFQKDEQNQQQNQEIATELRQTDKSFIQFRENEVSFFYCPIIVLPKLQGMQDFFRKCKFQNIAFDLKVLSGTVYLPVNDLEYESIGLLICQKGESRMNNEMSKVIEFLSKNYRNPNMKLRKQGDQVGMLRGIILSQIHKSGSYRKEQQNKLSQRNQGSLNNLQFF